MNFMQSVYNNEPIRVRVNSPSDITRLEVGWYWRVMSINRGTGEFTLSCAKVAYTNPSWWQRVRGAKSQRVVFTEDQE